MSAPGVYFAIYYEVPDRAFYRAAMTWAVETQGGVSTADSHMIFEPVSTERDFRRAWESIADESRRLGMRVAQGQVFSHASKGSNVDGLEFRPGARCTGWEESSCAPGGTVDGTLSQGEILALRQLDWAADGLLILSGCNSGLAGARGWSPAGAFARGQGVTTVGLSGYGYFSTEYNYYSTIGDDSRRVYLWSYRYGRNEPLSWLGMGDRARLPGVYHRP